jgi:hypothetical protein
MLAASTHQRLRAEHDEAPRDARSRHGPDRAADAEDREESTPLLGAVDVGGERPELRDGGVVEDADPEEKRDADGQARARHRREDQEVRGEETGTRT